MALEIYKKGQGSIARGAAYTIAAGLIVFGAIRLYATLGGHFLDVLAPAVPIVGDVDVRKVVAFIVGVAGLFFLHSFLNRPRSVDLMIETEQEMRKVSWPTLPEVWNATLVVLLVTAVFALTMSAFDRGIRAIFFLIFGSE